MHPLGSSYDCDHSVEGDAVRVPVVCVGREEVLQVLNEIKTGLAHEASYVSLELMVASGAL